MGSYTCDFASRTGLRAASQRCGPPAYVQRAPQKPFSTNQCANDGYWRHGLTRAMYCPGAVPIRILMHLHYHLVGVFARGTSPSGIGLH